MADGIIDILKKSGNKLLEAEAKGAEKWKKLRHTKADLELMLSRNIVELKFKPDSATDYVNLVLTGNNRLISVFSALKKEDKVKFSKSPFTGIKTKDRRSILAYDLVEGKLKTVSLLSWQVVNFIEITKENVLVLDQLLGDCLKKHK